MSESELPTMFTVKRDEHYCEPFGENWDAVLSRLTENQINFVGNEYGHLRHQINENYAELTSLRAELERVKAENEKKTAALELIIIRCNMADFDILTVGAICKMRELAREALLPAAPEEGE